jgi:hypothetical protein
MQKVDAETGDVVEADEIVKGYKAGDGYIEITDEDLEAIEVENSALPPAAVKASCLRRAWMDPASDKGCPVSSEVARHIRDGPGRPDS